MNLSELPANASRQELRKAMIRLRMEMHRQEIRHETHALLQPLRRARNFSTGLPLGGAPAWGIGALAVLGLFTRKRRGLVRLLRLGSVLYPLVMMALRRPGATPTAEPPAKI